MQMNKRKHARRFEQHIIWPNMIDLSRNIRVCWNCKTETGQILKLDYDRDNYTSTELVVHIAEQMAKNACKQIIDDGNGIAVLIADRRINYRRQKVNTDCIFEIHDKVKCGTANACMGLRHHTWLTWSGRSPRSRGGVIYVLQRTVI